MVTESGIKITPRHGDDEPEVRAGRLVFRGEVQWRVEGSPADLNVLANSLPGIAERLSENLLLLDFGNAVGFFDLPVLGQIEVKTDKFGDGDFDRMLLELMSIASALPFASGTTSALSYDRSIASDADVLYHAFVYLRYILSTKTCVEDRIIPALTLITRQPHRKLVRTDMTVPIERASRVEVATLMRIASQPLGLFHVDEALQNRIPLARALRGYLPVRIRQRHIDASVDTPENRFVKAFLQSAGGIISGMRQVATQTRARDAFAARVIAECGQMENALLPVVRDPLWNSIGPMAHLPVASTVLQRQRGYREVFQHFARLRLAARVPLAKDLVWRLLETKDIALLYEIWCFFAVVRVIKGFLGPPSRAQGPSYRSVGVTIDRELEVTWGDGTRLTYDASFRRGLRGERHSYSVGLRPDIALAVPGGLNQGLHLFDAKFRLDKLDSVMPRSDTSEAEDADDDGNAVTRTTFTRADLYKMHAYRDAIPDARSVWILYPGTDLRYFGEDGGAIVTAAGELPTILRGVGATPLTPSRSGEEALRRVLRGLLG